ncbi:MAG: SAM-dependent methyltransferase, partial [Sphingomonadales bacterium]|nr:SAM-dependent methyltransferase [Sphingomonadales bacterium]
MIVPDVPQTAAGVALHYDELDPAYRRIWGEHVHHGYWLTGRETPG